MRKEVLTAMILAAATSAQGTMVISEWMYSGADGEFIEFTNIGPEPVDMTGWTFEDDNGPGGLYPFDLSAFGAVQPGESVVLTEAIEIVFRLAWGLDPAVKVIGLLGDDASSKNIGRNDVIHLIDGSSQVIDSLAYGDTDFPGTPRSQNQSVNIPATDYGFTVAQTTWELATVGDAFGSWQSSGGDIGSPGQVVPEPATIGFLLIGLMGILRRRRC